MRTIIFSCFFTSIIILYSGVLYSQTSYQKVYGGTFYSTSESIRQTSDSGFVIAGYTAVPGGGSAPDGYLVKTDINGSMMWNTTFGGVHRDYPEVVQQAMDSGFFVAGFVQNNSTLNVQIYVAKMDNIGNLVWDKHIGGSSAFSSSAHDGVIANDSSFVVAGSSRRHTNDYDGFLFKINNSGTIVMGKHYGGTSQDFCNSVCKTSDGGYILVGSSASFLLTNYDIYLIKTDSLGNVMWSTTYGDSNSNNGISVQQTSDGGFIITGYTEGAMTNSRDIILIRTDSTGNYLWNKIFSGPDYEMAYSVFETPDHGYVITGDTRSFGSGFSDMFIIRTDISGDTLWTKTVGSSGFDEGRDIITNNLGGYALTGNSTFGKAIIFNSDSSGYFGCLENTAGFTVSSTLISAVPQVTVVSNSYFVSIGYLTSSNVMGADSTICTTVGLENIESENHELILYPNPASTTVCVETNSVMQNSCIEIVDIFGNCKYSTGKSGEKQIVISLNDFPKGIYFVNLRTDNGLIVSKLIVQ